MGKYPECSFCSCSGPGCGMEYSPEAHRREQALQESVERDRKARIQRTRLVAESIIHRISEEMRISAYDTDDVHTIRQIAHKGMDELLALIPR